MANHTTRNAPKSTAPMQGKTTSGDDLPDFSKWTELQIGYAPYWHPEEGKKFFGEILNRDDRNPNFTRYLIRSLKDEMCQRGPNNDLEGEKVLVKKGETFSISVYHSLANEFDFHLYYASVTRTHVPVLVESVKKTKTKTPNEDGTDRYVWQWRALVSPDDGRKLNAKRDDYRRLLEGPAEGA